MTKIFVKGIILLKICIHTWLRNEIYGIIINGKSLYHIFLEICVEIYMKKRGKEDHYAKGQRMSRFSELLKNYVQASGSTIYQLSKVSGVNRTSIQRAMSEERVLQEDALRKLVSCLNLTISEQENLEEAYEMACCGENLYIQRKRVKDLIQSAVQSYDAAKRSAQLEQHMELCVKGQKRKLYAGKYEISQMLEVLLKKELYGQMEPEVYLSVSMGYGFYASLFSVLHQTDFERIKVNQIVYFIKNPVVSGEVNPNLEIFAQVLPHVLLRGEEYKVYHCYRNHMEEPGNYQYFPYFLLFSDSMMLLAADYQTAWIEDDPEVLEYFRKTFQAQMQHSTRLMKPFVGVIDMGMHYVACDKGIEDLCWIEHQPCFIPLCDGGLIENVVYDNLPHRAAVINMVQERIAQFREIKNTVGIFNEESLEEFIQTGILVGIPEGYARPFTVEERIYLLEKLYDWCLEEREQVRAIDPAKFPVSRHISITAHGNKALTLYILDKETNSYRCIEIEESTLVQAFSDFIMYAIQSKWVYSKEKTLEIIQKYMTLAKTLL